MGMVTNLETTRSLNNSSDFDWGEVCDMVQDGYGRDSPTKGLVGQLGLWTAR
jgi:hypothetical protein